MQGYAGGVQHSSRFLLKWSIALERMQNLNADTLSRNPAMHAGHRRVRKCESPDLRTCMRTRELSVFICIVLGLCN